MKRLFLLTAMAASLSAAAQVWDKTFPQSDQVSVEKVSFKNRYDITVVADMYLPKNLNRSQEHAAIVIGHPFGGVKEQSSGLYAQQLAERGFVTLAFDLSYGGESGGTPRHLASPETYVDDFSAAVDFAGKQPFVDRNRIDQGDCDGQHVRYGAGAPPGVSGCDGCRRTQKIPRGNCGTTVE
mgnify:CR=1 FL=1